MFDAAAAAALSLPQAQAGRACRGDSYAHDELLALVSAA
jgi:hypothetical protein